MKSDEFLNLYRTLEEVLSEKYSDRTRNYGSVVVQFMNDVEGRQFKDKLNPVSYTHLTLPTKA